jgi:predicted DNA-binding WGR domain protein
MERRSLQYTDAKSDKFWTITLEGKSHTVQYGRVGTTGQSQTKEFGSEAEAQKSFQKLLQEKLKKGYVEIESINAAAQTDVQRSTVQCQEDTVPQPSARPESKQDVYAALQTQLTQNKKELCELAALDAIPDAFIPLLDLEIKVAIAEQSNSSPRILEYLVNDAHDTVRQTLARNTDLPTHLLEKLAEDKNRSVRLSLASNGNAPSDALAKLINDPYEDIRRKVLDHANTPKPNKQIFTSIINHASPHERQYFSVLRGLASQRASDWISSLRFYQSFYENNPATDLNTPQTTLESLSEHPDASMRTAVAQNPSCPESLLRKLAKDPYTVSHNEYSGVGAYVIRKQVQEAVAINAHVPVDLLAEFVQTRNLFLFLAVAHNPCCPSELLEAMAQEQDLLYPCSSGSPRHQSLYLQDLKLEIAHHPNTPIHVLEEIAKYTAPKTDIAHLRHKLYGTSKYVSQAAQANYRCQYAGIAKNPDTPTNQIQKMTKHRDSWVRVIAAQNAQGLQFLLSNHLKDKLSLTRLLVIMHRAIPISTIQELSVSNAWHDRYAVTQNPSTPTEILQQLVQDAEPIVQNAAKTALGLEVFVAQPMAQAEVAQVLKQAKPVERDPNTSEQPAVLEKLEIVRSLNLKPEDWLWATWQPLNPKHRNSIQPFDKEQCVKQLQRIPCTTRGYFDVQWDKANLPVLMSREEANFWL